VCRMPSIPGPRTDRPMMNALWRRRHAIP
jgi:hypothetical protein